MDKKTNQISLVPKSARIVLIDPFRATFVTSFYSTNPAGVNAIGTWDTESLVPTGGGKISREGEDYIIFIPYTNILLIEYEVENRERPVKTGDVEFARPSTTGRNYLG